VKDHWSNTALFKKLSSSLKSGQMAISMLPTYRADVFLFRWGPLRKAWKLMKLFIRATAFYWNSWILGKSIDAPPVFIVGCGHSGTSLLLAVLGSHPTIYPIPLEDGVSRDLDQMSNTFKLFDWVTLSVGAHRWIEKTPNHIYRIKSILEMNPDARIIIIIRDGRDVAASLKARYRTATLGAERWVRDNQAGIKFHNHPNVHVMKYEDMIENFEDTLRAIMTFLNEEYVDDLRHFHRSPRLWYSNEITRTESDRPENHINHRNWQINQPLFDGRGRHKMLTQEELKAVQSVAGELLQEFGYVQS